METVEVIENMRQELKSTNEESCLDMGYCKRTLYVETAFAVSCPLQVYSRIEELTYVSF